MRKNEVDDARLPHDGVGFITVMPGGEGAGGEGAAAGADVVDVTMEGAGVAPGALTNCMVSMRITALGMFAAWLAELSMV